ncbi:unnamed protein product [Clonostachys byssicola]|uniref:CENP-V/GFA domain-containing protein n=1 Tax=Clonostachys byssicola TaxID=160290 RepID=A0A9N9U8F8_9HYPO|nr:unnamed protein product [Clonostachys byssicola]
MAHVSCFCGGVTQNVRPKISTASNGIALSLCHCNTCRHTTGLLCTSYLPIQEPEISANLRIFRTSGKSARYFCRICGCHIFRNEEYNRGEAEWGVATGVVSRTDDDVIGEVKFTDHKHVSDTKDGGIAKWISFEDKEWISEEADRPEIDSAQSESLEAACACGTVRFHLTRPDAASLVPRRNYPDLTHAYCETAASILSNVSDEKWWVRGGKYLAGTCACQSCRLASGFEIQTWTFVPRANIFIQIPDRETTTANIPLDFGSLPPGILQGYKSSPAVTREFCGTCGATIFWHETEDTEVIDVSVGLLRGSDGACAGSWLKWWKDRVSFVEEVQSGRNGPFATAAKSLIDTLSNGMKGELVNQYTT